MSEQRVAEEAHDPAGVGYAPNVPCGIPAHRGRGDPGGLGGAVTEVDLAEPPGYGINAPAVPFDGSLPTYIRITDIGNDGRFKPNTAGLGERSAGHTLLPQAGGLGVCAYGS